MLWAVLASLALEKPMVTLIWTAELRRRLLLLVRERVISELVGVAAYDSEPLVIDATIAALSED